MKKIALQFKLFKKVIMYKKPLIISLSVIIIASFVLVSSGAILAYQRGSTPESGADSRVSILKDNLIDLEYGEETTNPDWGSALNRIKTAAKWQPDGDTNVDEVAKGKTFYSADRKLEIGTYPQPGPCPNQAYPDGHTLATNENNCDLAWESVSDIVGADKRDPRTGLVWSHHVIWNGSKFAFSPASTAKMGYFNSEGDGYRGFKGNFCNGGTNGWRTPTQKEWLQAYVDGAYYNLTLAPDMSVYWTTFQEHFDLSTGELYGVDWRDSQYARCVR